MGFIQNRAHYFFFTRVVKAKNRDAQMILEKDQGLAFPRKAKGKKEPKPLRSKPTNYQKASVSEEMLQNFAEEEATRYALDCHHIPQELYQFLASSSLTLTKELKEFLCAFMYGRPDIELKKRIDGTPYNLSLYLELKTDSPQSKLRATQKRFLRGLNFETPRNKEEIKEIFHNFNETSYEMD